MLQRKKLSLDLSCESDSCDGVACEREASSTDVKQNRNRKSLLPLTFLGSECEMKLDASAAKEASTKQHVAHVFRYSSGTRLLYANHAQPHESRWHKRAISLSFERGGSCRKKICKITKNHMVISLRVVLGGGTVSLSTHVPVQNHATVSGHSLVRATASQPVSTRIMAQPPPPPPIVGFLVAKR